MPPSESSKPSKTSPAPWPSEQDDWEEYDESLESGGEMDVDDAAPESWRPVMTPKQRWTNFAGINALGIPGTVAYWWWRFDGEEVGGSRTASLYFMLALWCLFSVCMVLMVVGFNYNDRKRLAEREYKSKEAHDTSDRF